ncbi:hypothetical protein ACT691_11755, partial [Vibrio metschnikovii]
TPPSSAEMRCSKKNSITRSDLHNYDDINITHGETFKIKRSARMFVHHSKLDEVVLINGFTTTGF